MTVDFDNYMNDRGELNVAGEHAVKLGLDVLVEACGRQQQANGWRDEDRDLLEELFLVTSEVVEAGEEYRDHRQYNEIYYNSEKPDKPEGIPTELVDAIIRIGDISEKYGIDLYSAFITKFNYNHTRGYRHGGKKA